MEVSYHIAGVNLLASGWEVYVISNKVLFMAKAKDVPVPVTSFLL